MALRHLALSPWTPLPALPSPGSWMRRVCGWVSRKRGNCPTLSLPVAHRLDTKHVREARSGQAQLTSRL